MRSIATRKALAMLAPHVDEIHAGVAADRQTIERAGIGRAASVLLTTNDDAVNIYLAVFCRKLNPGVHIVSRITHERNVEAIHRAGADFVLSYTSLGVDSIMSLVNDAATVMLAKGCGCSRCESRPHWWGSRCHKPASVHGRASVLWLSRISRRSRRS
jgi:Trk K+ transport system NAD-binding subunit